MDGYVKMRPIVKPRSRYRFIVKMKTKWTHKMKRHTKSNAQSSYRTSIVRYLRTDKNY